MKDLSSPAMQKIFKSIRRLDICLYAVMCLVLASVIALSVFGLTSIKNYSTELNWAQILYIVIMAATCVFYTAVFIINVVIRKPYRIAMREHVEETFAEHEDTLRGGKNVEINLYLAGDKLAVTKQGKEDVIFFDVTPLKKYPSVCAYLLSLVKKYLAAYYAQNIADGYYSVTVTDAINKKPKIKRIVVDGTPVKPKAKNPFLNKGEKVDKE